MGQTAWGYDRVRVLVCTHKHTHAVHKKGEFLGVGTPLGP